MSCDVLPTCEEGLGVEKKKKKACYPDEDGGREPRGRATFSLTRARKDQSSQARKKTGATQPGPFLQRWEQDQD